MAEALEIPVQHRCHLGRLTDELAERAREGERGARLAERARAALDQLLASGDFATCCVPAYLAVAPAVFERELQVAVASAGGEARHARVALADRSEGCAAPARGWLGCLRGGARRAGGSRESER